MRKTFKYRIYPTKKQEIILNSQLECCRMLYNNFLSEKKSLWETEKRSLSLYDLHAQLPGLKIQFPDLSNVYSTVLQDVAKRVDLAYQAFFRRVKSGEKEAGFPRFKGYGRYDSLSYKQYGSGIKLISKSGSVILSLSGVGHIKIIFHRELQGTPKTAIIKRSSTNKWYVSFSCEIEQPQPLEKSPLNVGIDVGLETFAYMSDNSKIENEHFFKTEEKNLAKANRKFAKFPKPSKNIPNTKARLKVKKALCRVHERIKFKREDFSHQKSRMVIDKYQIIVVEDLSIKQMKENTFKGLRKSISEVAWKSFFQLLYSKAAEAGRTVISVNPKYTSQDCSDCGNRVKKKLSQRIHECKKCGLKIHRDLNASINILRIGLDSLGIKSLEA
jgi:putative transposase